MRALATGGRRTGLLLGAAVAGCAALALLPGEVGPLAARAGVAAVAVAAGALCWRGRRAAVTPALRVTALAALGRAGAVAVVEVDGRRFLLGAAERSVELLAELGPATGGGAP